MADLHSNIFGHAPPPSNLIHFHAVFRKFWSNDRLAPDTYFRVGAP